MTCLRCAGWCVRECVACDYGALDLLVFRCVNCGARHELGLGVSRWKSVPLLDTPRDRDRLSRKRPHQR
jgi:hypothetical protein